MGVSQPDLSLIPDYSFLDPDSGYQISKRDHVTMRSNYRLVANNLLDLSHAAYLHEGILAYPESVRAEISVREEGNYVYVERNRTNVKPALLPDLLFRGDGQPVDVMTVMRWSAPCHLMNDNMTFPVGGRIEEGAGLYGAHILTPVTETSTLYHFAAARRGVPFEGDEQTAAEVRKKMSELRRIAFEEQDEPIVEAQQRYLLKHPEAKPVLLKIDTGPARCNRILDKLISAETQHEQ
ncbi:hypothetical protein AS156_18825 [Bradyrhizobium macuxiense]|uniref:Vanillate O-demethylase oxygenase-like C-terminal catalytic domain-containing protein n=2 Tax=Bradyrhizobium macuxiense TaxID=1755647 RepID=A0A109JGQ8_9BRAD|nr:hypothetical protein AS156_18825 [Bradyrhizobium macuxiense]